MKRLKTILLILTICSGCAERLGVNDWIYRAGDVIDYKGIRIEDKANKVKSEMDK